MRRFGPIAVTILTILPVPSAWADPPAKSPQLATPDAPPRQGVVKPPGDVDPAIHAPAPADGTMRVIVPPAAKGGTAVVPK